MKISAIAARIPKWLALPLGILLLPFSMALPLLVRRAVRRYPQERLVARRAHEILDAREKFGALRQIVLEGLANWNEASWLARLAWGWWAKSLRACLNDLDVLLARLS